MNKYLLYIIFSGIILIGGLGLYKLSSRSPKPTFINWYKSAHRFSPDPGSAFPKLNVYEFTSPPLKIDTIYRSMQGPFHVNHIEIKNEKRNFFEKLRGKPEVYWLVGYSAEVINEKGETISDDFLCHNNLDIYDNTALPWKPNAFGSFQRVFTLTAGQTQIMLPKGTGVPVLGNTTLAITSQALNQNYRDTLLNTKQRVKIFYIKDSELEQPMTALYQQAIYVTKQLSGPAGFYNSPPVDLTPQAPINDYISSEINDSLSCCMIKTYDPNFNPYKDKYGRRFTGHWSFAPGKETLLSDITEMLSLPYHSKLYYIGMHVHPFCDTLELIDKTNNKTIFKGINENYTHKIGLHYIDHYENDNGIELKQTHRYFLKSTYHNTSSNKHTAMATMFLYLAEK